MASSSAKELARQVGHDLRALRLRRNLTQVELAGLAGVSVRSLKNLEHGTATLRTLVGVVRALEHQEWLGVIGVGPTMGTRPMPLRQRASGRHAKNQK